MTRRNNPLSPERWAIDISLVLNAVLGANRFPVDVAEVAQEISAQKFPDDPITLVKGDRLPKFDGALYRAPAGKKGWGIFYNTDISSRGRINFTLAHEFGHYLLHRVQFPDGLRCGEQDVVRWDTEYGQIEHQANVFAANLLMPLDDYRRQIDAKSDVTLDMIEACRDRYRVSLIAAILRWLQYTTRRAILVVSRDGFILWSRSSDAALKSGAYFKTVGRPPVPVPALSLAASPMTVVNGGAGIKHPGNVWFREEVREMAVHAEQYDFVISLLMLPNENRTWHAEERVEDTFDRFQRR